MLLTRHYYSINPQLFVGAFGVKVDYDLDQVGDPLVLNDGEEIKENFFDAFSFSISCDGPLGDWVDLGGLSWRIISPQLQEAFSMARNAGSIKYYELPEHLLKLNSRLRGYRILGVKEKISCLNTEKSDLRWIEFQGVKSIIGVHSAVLEVAKIPSLVEIFLISEYPVFVVLDSRIVKLLKQKHVTGCYLEMLTSC